MNFHPSARMQIYWAGWALRAGGSELQGLLSCLSSVSPPCDFVWLLWSRTSLVAQRVKHLPTMWETQVLSLGWEGLLEREMATHSSILAWKIPWMEEPGGLQSMALQRVGHDRVTSLSLSFTLWSRKEFIIWAPWTQIVGSMGDLYDSIVQFLFCSKEKAQLREFMGFIPSDITNLCRVGWIFKILISS